MTSPLRHLLGISQPITLTFKNCTVLVYPEQQHLVTQFPDGTEVPACPNHDPESIARAQSLGYGSDLWAMTFDHEITHTLMAEIDGLPYSPALWAVAHPADQRNAQQLHKEECEVLRLQKLIRAYLNYSEPLR